MIGKIILFILITPIIMAIVGVILCVGGLFIGLEISDDLGIGFSIITIPIVLLTIFLKSIHIFFMKKQ